ncbi:hypothetical protein HQ545_02845, partial [Candidatus Woesearchaeota archaeon]|nr:hypothetical protein [Candidatus Woesearchaeota archaeon]
KNIITVEPDTEKEIIMIITPNMTDLEKMDYQSSINTRLEGQKIGYEDNISIVIKKERSFEMSYVLYALIGILVLGSIILIIEILRRKKKNSKINK